MTGFSITDFTPADQDEVRELVLQGLGEHWGVIEDGHNPDLDDIAESYASGRTVVVRSEGAVVATGSIVPRSDADAEIVRMSVVSSARRQGLGRTVVEELLDTARSWGCTRVVLETTSTWDDAKGLYLACGFRITHTEMSEYGEDTWFEYVL